MPLSKSKPYFLKLRDAVLRIKPEDKTSKNASNHLILGDYIQYLGETSGDWVKVRSRRTTGWLKEEWLTAKRGLEVNFVDIGQGDGIHMVTPKDEVILIDAGEGLGFDGKGGDNMARFLNWRYNLRNRKVKGVEGVTASTEGVLEPYPIDHAVISHPDLDHYYGFLNIFGNKKLDIKKIYHNGIVERSRPSDDDSDWMYDLGRKVQADPNVKKYHLWDTVLTNKEMKDLLDANTTSGKYYLKTLVAARQNKSTKFEFLDSTKEHFEHFHGSNALEMEILSPITEEITIDGETRTCLPKIGNEGETKNGHSIVFQLRYGKLRMILGGDLNAKSQDYLGQKYSGIETKLSDLEKGIHKIEEKLKSSSLSASKRLDLEADLDEKTKLLDLIISRLSKKFKTDIAKACHHGASDVLDSFLMAINPIATIISSGDNESHSHPRPDALGAFGKSSRGKRPLLFSTELARSSAEFSYPIKFFSVLKKLEEHRDAQTTQKAKDVIQKRMENLRDCNVVKYGMITVRSDGEMVIIAQKLEVKRSEAQKWDIYELRWNDRSNEFEYIEKGH